jgi:hypothetical protein
MPDASKMPARIWARLCGGGVRLPSGASYQTLVGDSIEHEGRTIYVRADLADEHASELATSLREVRDMLWARPDIVEKLRPLMGFAEQKISDRAAAALTAWEASNPARQASNGDRHAGEKGE